MPITTTHGVTVTVYDTDGSTALNGVDVYATNLSTGQQLTGNNVGRTGSNGVAEIDVANIGPYNDGDTIEIYAYRVGKRAKTTYVVSTIAESGTATLTMSQATAYTTATKVAQLLQVDAYVVNPSDGRPSSVMVEDVIKRWEDYIDYETKHAWRTRYSGTDSGDNQTQQWEYYNVDRGYRRNAGIPVFLRHRKIKNLASGSGDAFEVFEGTSTNEGTSETWTSWLTGKTQNRTGDFWINHDQGILFIRSLLFRNTPFKIRIKYRYGDTVVPKDVEDACTKFAASDLMLMGHGLNARSNAINYRELVEMWRADAMRVIENRREMQPVTAKLSG